MPHTRRSFTLGSTFAFLTGTGAGAQDAAPELPDCEPKTTSTNAWQINASLRRGGSGDALGIQRLRQLGDRWAFRRTTPGDTWDTVGSGVTLSFRDQEVDAERPEQATTRLFVSFTPMFTDAAGAETRLIPFAPGATELTVTLSYFLDISRDGQRDRVAEGTREVTVKTDDRTHFFAFDVPKSVVRGVGQQAIIGLQFSDDFGLGAIANIDGLAYAATLGDDLVIRTKREVAAGQCAIPAPTGGCFVVTAAHEAGRELDGKPVDLDLILSARDDLLASMPQYRPAANQYYATAPELVERIGQSNQRHDIYARFVRRAVRPAEWFIRRGLPKLGFVWLGIGIEVLYKRHLPGVLPPSAFAPGRKRA